VLYSINISKVLYTAEMKTFSEFMSICEAYDAAFMSGAQILKVGAGGSGKIGSERKKSEPEKRRKSQPKAGGERKPTEYKPRKDIGSQRQASTRVQQPTQERGSAALSPKESARKAFLERKAKEAGKKTPTAAELLSKKKPAEVDKRPEGQPKRAVVGMSRAERSRITKQGQKKLETLVRQSEAEKQGKKPEDVKLTGGKSGEKYQTWK
jgi:hypothetical protein